MKTQYLPLLLILFILSCSTKEHKSDHLIDHTSRDHSSLRFERIDSSKIVFNHGYAFDTKLYDLSFIGKVENGNKYPFLIFSGRDCTECDENISVYIHSPSDGALDVENGQNRYQYPGKEKDYESDTILSKSRAFYGQVLINTKGVIWFEKRLMENGTWGDFVYLAKIENGSKKDTLLKDYTIINQTLNMQKQGLCKEIRGIEYSTEP